jgi:hypothetical protein
MGSQHDKSDREHEKHGQGSQHGQQQHGGKPGQGHTGQGQGSQGHSGQQGQHGG